MNFFQKIGNSLARFMYWRNGVDQLGFVTLWAAHYSGRGQPLCPEPGGLQHSVGGGHGADCVDGVPHVFQEPAQAPGGECAVHEQGGLSPAAGPVPQPGQGAQVFHLPQLPHGVPGTPGQGPHRHHLPQVPHRNPRQKLTTRNNPPPARSLRAGDFCGQKYSFFVKTIIARRLLRYNLPIRAAIRRMAERCVYGKYHLGRAADSGGRAVGLAGRPAQEEGPAAV